MVTLSTELSEIDVTDNHPFWVIGGAELESRPILSQLQGEDFKRLQRGRWVSARDIHIGDTLVSTSGESIRITAATSRDVVDFEVCNLTVSGSKNFAVGVEEILTHNEGFCGALTQSTKDPVKRAEFEAARKRLAKQFGVEEKYIHGHHVIQNRIPTQIDDIVDGKRIGSYDKVDSNRSSSQQSAWYINDLHKVAKEHKIDLFDVATYGTDDLAREAAKKAAKNGETLSNLTLAPNGKGTHTLATHKAVWERLNAVRDDAQLFKLRLEQIGEDFLQGKLPPP